MPEAVSTQVREGDMKNAFTHASTNALRHLQVYIWDKIMPEGIIHEVREGGTRNAFRHFRDVEL